MRASLWRGLAALLGGAITVGGPALGATGTRARAYRRPVRGLAAPVSSTSTPVYSPEFSLKSRIATKTAEVNASNNPNAVYSETAIAINPASPNAVVTGANYLAFKAPMASFLSTSTGASYQPIPVPPSGQDTTDPSVAFDRAGNAYYSFLLALSGDVYRPVVDILPAGTSIWQGPYYVSATKGDDDKSYMTVDNSPTSQFPGRVYVAWDRNNPDGTQSIFVGRSDNGRDWLTPVRADDVTSSGALIYATPATGPNGELYVVWNDYAPANAGFLVLDRSLDGGVTFAKDIVVSSLRLNLQPNPSDPNSIYAIPAQPQRGIAACPSIGVDVSNGPRRGWVYVCYNDVAVGKLAGNADTDIFLRRSTDGGLTWSAPVRVNDDATATSQFFPWMSVDPVDGSLNISWYDCRLDPVTNKKANVYYSRSLDGGATFEPNMRVTSAPSDQTVGGDPNGNDYGDYEGISAFGGQVNPVWTDNRNGGLNQVYAATLIQPGTPPVNLVQSTCAVAIPPGASLSVRNLVLYATLTGPSRTLTAEWEVKPAGTPFDGLNTTVGAPVAYNGAPVVVGLTLNNLANGGYHWRVRALRGDGQGAPGNWTSFNPAGTTTADFVIGGAPYTSQDVAAALQIAGGVRAATPADILRLSVTDNASGAKGCDGTITLADAVRIARTVAGLETLP